MSTFKELLQKITGITPTTNELTTLATMPKTTTSKDRAGTFNPNIVAKSISKVRQDIKDWNEALDKARNVDNLVRYPLYNLYINIEDDALLSSQVENRRLAALSTAFEFKTATNEVNKELTDTWQNNRALSDIFKHILNTRFKGHHLIELSIENGQLKVDVLPQQNVNPLHGKLIYDYTDDSKFIKYREQKEYGTWLLEFGDAMDFGLLNKAVPHILFKRFAHSCWSELCEVAGIPPRFLKTDTQNPGMLARAKNMMNTLGAAAWFIIDEEESFEFAKNYTNPDGKVYDNLMKVCNNEISLLISGAIIGQDTSNGSRSKDESSQKVLQRLIDSDLTLIEQYMESTVIPALVAIGLLPAGTRFSFVKSVDLTELWTRTEKALDYYAIPPDWISSTFGIPVQDKPQDSSTTKLSALDGFFRLRADTHQISPKYYFEALHHRLNYLYDCGCEDCKQLLMMNDKLSINNQLLKAIEKAFKHLHKKGSYDANDIEDYQDLINETAAQLNYAIADNKLPERMLQSLENDVFLFSGLKTHAQLTEASHQLLNADKTIKPFNQFSQDVAKIKQNYNEQYLQAEYQFAVQSAQNAAHWADVQKSEGKYPLQYRTAADSRVRESHQQLHNITLPANDAFWDFYYPPNGWRCRCRAIEVLPNQALSDSKEALAKGETATTQIGKDGKNRLAIFRFNPGRQGVVFPPNHPYRKIKDADVVEKKLKEVKITKSFVPEALANYEKTLGISVDKTIFSYLTREVPLVHTNINKTIKSRGAYFLPGSNNYVKIPFDERRKNSKWYSEAVIYHEFGHAVDNHNGLRNEKGVTDLMDKYRDIYSKEGNKKYIEINNKLERFYGYARKNNLHDFKEKIGATADTIESLTKGKSINDHPIGWGHGESYFSRKGMPEAEFIAHLFENKFAENEVFKKLMPELYEEGIAYIENIKQK